MAFAVFRFFDIVKPWPICWFDLRVPGGLGVMLDDILAAGYSILALLLIQHFYLL
ncbi:MAG: phosphatidylglycerophosphatase A [Iodobacter sp.]